MTDTSEAMLAVEYMALQVRSFLKGLRPPTSRADQAAAIAQHSADIAVLQMRMNALEELVLRRNDRTGPPRARAPSD